MKPLLAILGLIAACAACCAIPLAVPMLLALSSVASAFSGFETAAAVMGGVAAIALAVAAWQRAGKTRRCSLWCGNSCAGGCP
jgi:hypothetical protein